MKIRKKIDAATTFGLTPARRAVKTRFTVTKWIPNDSYPMRRHVCLSTLGEGAFG